ncbi:MAG: PAS domain S-box protein [Ginsengibacter sp.]
MNHDGLILNSQNSLPHSLKEASDYRYILEHFSILSITDHKGIIAYVNDNFCKISKYSREELIGKDHRILNSGLHPQECIKHMWNTIADGKIWKGELRNKAKDGTLYWVDTTIFPSTNDEEKTGRYIAISTDITALKKLKEQQELSVLIINSSDDAIFSKDLNSIITSWNTGAEKTFGYKAEEIIGKSISILVPPPLIGEEKKIIERIKSGEYIDHYQTERIRKDGKKIFVSISISPIKDSTGKIIGASKISRDITENKEVKEKLSKVSRLYAFTSAINKSIVHINNEQELLDNACKISTSIGGFKTAWIGMLRNDGTLNFMSSDGDQSAIQASEKNPGIRYDDPRVADTPTAKALKTGHFVVSNDIQHDTAMTKWRSIFDKTGVKSILTFPIKKFGKVVGVFSLHSEIENFFDREEMALLEEAVDDISFALENYVKEKWHRETEIKISKNEMRLKRAQSIAHIGHWEYYFDTGISEWSEELCRIYGIDPLSDKQSLQQWQSFIHPEDLHYITEMMNKQQQSLHTLSFEYRILRRDGMVRYVHTESKPELDENGKSIGIYGITLDITEQKLAEIERTKMVNDLVMRNKDLEQFAYIVSHNLRAPLANIIGATYLLNDPALNSEAQEKLKKSHRESVGILDEVIKDLSHILQVKREINEVKEKVSFTSLVRDIKISIANIIENNSVKFEHDFSEVDEMITLKSYLYSIFYNLISNSIKYRQQGVPCIIRIKSSIAKNYIQIVFTDNGMGIDLDKKGEQVFSLYKRFHPAIEGKGMGLFLVKTQVETLGGIISVTSKVNEGTEFTIEFER